MKTRTLAVTILLAGWPTVVPSMQNGAPEAGGLSGAVVEDHTGSPLAGAGVRLTQGGRVLATAETDRGGRFLIRGRVAGEFLLEVQKLHHVPVVARLKRSPEGAGAPLPALRLIRHGAISASTFPGAGTFTVVERVPDGVVPRRPGTGVRDGDGLFRLFGLPPGRYAVLGQAVLDGRALTGLTVPLNAPPDLVISGGEEHAGLVFPAGVREYDARG